MMKLLYANDGLWGGGVEKLLNDLLPRINEEYVADLLVLDWKDEKYRKSLSDTGVHVEAIPDNIQGILPRILYIKNFIENGNYDILHANEFPMLYYCAIAGRLAKNHPKLVVTEHDTSNGRRKYKILRQLERFIYGKYDRIISISPETQASIKKWLSPMNDEKFITVYNGIPIDKFINAKSYADRRILFPGISDDDILLCDVARLSEKKNHPFLFDVMEKLPERYKLVLCGDGELEENLKEDVRKRGLSGRIRFIGFRSDVAAIMKTSDIIVVPSKWEGFGLIAVEAMACGKPLVYSDSPGITAVVGDGGLKVRQGDCAGFVKTIESLRSKTVREQLISKAKNRCKKFDIETMKDNYIQIYRDI